MFEAVLNELSVQEPSSTATVRDVIFEFVDALVEIQRTAGSIRLRCPPGSEHAPITDGYSLHAFSVDRTFRRDAEALRRQRVLLSARSKTLSPFPPSLDEWCLMPEGAECHGIAAACRSRTFVVSLLTTPRWDSASLEVRERWIEAKTCNLRERSHKVPHAASRSHVVEHAEWLREWDGDAGRASLRGRIDLTRCHFVPASQYRGGKHVQGSTNEQRQLNACKREEGGRCNGQFLAAMPDGSLIGDGEISTWEEKVLREAIEGQHEVRCHGDAFHIYAHMGHSIGYASETGEETNVIRVEWSSHQVHSHPRSYSS